MFNLASMLQFQVLPHFAFLTKGYTYTIRHGLAKGLKRTGGFSFLPFIGLTLEEKFLAILNLTNEVIYDIGAANGLLTAFFASQAKYVVAFEPNPTLYQHLCEIVKLNDFRNVETLPIAISDKTYTDTLFFPKGIEGVSSLDENEKKRISKLKNHRHATVQVESIDRAISRHKLPSATFIKIDVQGLEFRVLEGMKETIARNKPNLLVEIHGTHEKWQEQSAKRVVIFLEANGYKIHYIEGNKSIDHGSFHIIRSNEHLYAT